MEDTTGAIVSVVTDVNMGFYAGESHIPFPNTPALRGIGLKWSLTAHGETLTLTQRAVVLGADFVFNQVTDMARTAIEYAVVSTPPLCLYRHTLWGACQHFQRNLPENGRAGGRVTFQNEIIPVDAGTSWMGTLSKKPSTVEFSPALLGHVMVKKN